MKSDEFEGLWPLARRHRLHGYKRELARDVLSGGVNHLIGHPQIWVAAEHVEVARELLDRAFDDDPET